MTYTGLELFMENLKQLSYNKDNPLINNNQKILRERPQIQLLYEELSFMIQIMFVEKRNDLNDIEQVNDLKIRFKDVALEAYYIIGLFVYSSHESPNFSSSCLSMGLDGSKHSRDSKNAKSNSSINYRDTTSPPPSRYDFIYHFLKGKNVQKSINNVQKSINYTRSLNLKNVMRAINSIEMEFIMILHRLKMDSSPSIKPLKMQAAIANAAGTSGPRNPLGMKKVFEEIVVGLEHDVELIRDKLVEEQKQVDVVSIVGMGGVGKTTLASKVFNDPFVVYHFHVRAWVSISQTYERQDLLIQILTSIGIEFDPLSASDSQLREKLHKRLMGKRYLIVVDDIWSIEAWDDLKLFFPNCNTRSRILITSRIKEVALLAKLHSFVHHLECLTDEESWELLCKKVFHDNDCPESLIEPGMQIAKSCYGLPLAVVVIAGVLAKEPAHKGSWERVGQRVSSYVVSDQHGHMDILGLSYEHLPLHLKDCFLYLGGFPEHHKFRVQKLIWLWIAEGFVQEDGNRSLEDIGEDYLMELVDRNLVVVLDRKFDGAIKACFVHDLLRELCLKRASKGNFSLKINTPMSSFHSMGQHKPIRIFTRNRNFFVNNPFDESSPWVQSLLCFHKGSFLSKIPKEYFCDYPLLTVLDLQKCEFVDFPPAIGLLFHLRYLAFWYMKGFPSSICNLWNLQTIIARSYKHVYLPKAISNLMNLRHLWSDGYFYFPSVEKPMNLQTISDVALRDVSKRWENFFPGIKKLTCRTLILKNQDFELLNSLETLMWINMDLRTLQFGDRLTADGKFQKIHVTFPPSLKKLTLVGCCLPWSDMSVIQSLPNLEVLNILSNAFVGPKWEAGETRFQQLKFLKLEGLDIRRWEVSSINFPCLKHLVLDKCNYLEEIPLEIGDISTLELIDVDDSCSSVVDSLDNIREEQQNFGNYDLQINVREAVRPERFNRKLRASALTTSEVSSKYLDFMKFAKERTFDRH